MKLFSKRTNKRIARILVGCLLMPLVMTFVFAVPVAAAEEGLGKDDVLKGVAIALGVIVVIKFAQAFFSDLQKPEPSTNKKPAVGYTDDDLELLARVIYAESRGEPYEGQVAVAAVVLNRVKSSHFPNTIRGVVYAPGQFTSVSDGQINLKPNETAYRAAREALAGKDPSYGALFFYNPKTARTLSWLSTRKTTVQIGNHVFAK